MKSKQQLFDEVLAHIRAQGRPSFSYSGGGKLRCVYRSPDGCKCGIGGVMPDDVYQPRFDDSGGLVVLDLPHSTLKAMGINPGYKSILDFVYDLQQAHDGAGAASFNNKECSFMATFEASMQKLATAHHLQYASSN